MTEPIEGLRLLKSQIDALQGQLPSCVAACRAQGSSWAEIGLSLGISQQAAHKRFAGLPRKGGEPALSDDEYLPLFTTPQE